jgi:hypothetical protein
MVYCRFYGHFPPLGLMVLSRRRDRRGLGALGAVVQSLCTLSVPQVWVSMDRPCLSQDE